MYRLAEEDGENEEGRNVPFETFREDSFWSVHSEVLSVFVLSSPVYHFMGGLQKKKRPIFSFSDGAFRGFVKAVLSREKNWTSEIFSLQSARTDVERREFYPRPRSAGS